MTHVKYSRQYLEDLPLAKLKEIASQLGTKPVIDRRYKKSWVEVIVRKQDEVIAIESVVNDLNSWIIDQNEVNEQFPQLCCDALHLDIVDLEMAYGDIVIPPGMPSVEVYDSSNRHRRLLGVITKHPNQDTYHTINGSYDDIHTAAMGLCHPSDVLFAKKTALKQLDKMRLMPEYF